MSGTAPAGGLRDRLRSSSLGLRLALAGAAVTAVVVGATFAILQARVSADVRRVFVEELAASQRDARRLQDEELRLLLATSALVSTSPTLRAALQTWRMEATQGLSTRGDLLATVQREVERIAGDLDRDLLVVTDDAGRVLAAAGRVAPPPAGTDLGALPAVRYALLAESVSADSGFGVLRSGAVPLQAGCVAIVVAGVPIGVLVIGERLDRLLPTRDGPGGTRAVVAAATVLASTFEAAEPGAPWTPPPSENGPTRLALGGERYVAAVVPLGATEDGTPATLTLLRSESAAVRPILRTLRRNFLVFGLVAILLVAGSAVAVSRATLRPLARFVGFLRSGADSAVLERFAAEGSAEEVRTLTEAYNGLVESLQRHRAQLEARASELRATNTSLEEQMRERERAERALRASEEALRQSQRLESLGTLAGGVAHDFNNLLSVILGHADVAARSLPPGSAEAGDLEQIAQAAERASGLVRQLLAFSRKQVLQPQVLDLNRVVAEMQSMLMRLIGEHILLETRLAPGLAPVLADPGQVEQVVMNLVINARDAMREGGSVLIETANVRFEGQGEAEGMAPGPAVMLAVRDTGAGMDEATRQRIFEPFFTTKAPGKGTGLGLSTVYGIVRQSGGAITAESAPGKGCTFRCYFPPTEAARAASAQAAAASAGRGSETVLVAEDETQLRALVRRSLAALGYTVLEAADGLEALDVAAAHEGPIHLLVTDVVMPHLSGSELVRRLRERRPGMRVVFISGYAEEAIERRGLLAPGAVFLQKPVRQDHLGRVVRDVLDGAEPARETA